MSLFLPEKNALFLHVPRVAGRYVYAAISMSRVPCERWRDVSPVYDHRLCGSSKRGIEHAPLPLYYPEFFSQVRFVFAFVRHPVNFYVSFWRQMMSGYGRHPGKWPDYVKDPVRLSLGAFRWWRPDFESWVNAMIENEPAWATRLFERYVGGEGSEICHFVGRLETLNRDLREVLTILGYGDEWDRFEREVLPRRLPYHKRRWHIKSEYVPEIRVSMKLRKRILWSERALVRRFYSGEGKDKRVYRRPNGRLA